MIKENFVDLKTRFFTSAFSVVIVGLLLWFSTNPIIQFIVVVFFAALAIVAIWEYLEMLKVKKIELPFWLLSTLAAVFIFANYLSILHIGVSAVTGMVIAAAFFIIFFYHFSKVDGALVNIPTGIFAAFYVVVPLALMLRILYPSTISTIFTDGRLWIAYLIVTTKMTDVGAYFAGKLWGRGQLAPHLSPKKTLTGAVAGLITALAVSLLFGMIAKWMPRHLFYLSYMHALLLGGLIGIFAQLGDLAESLLKRDAKVKDSNKLPGVGGILDMLDSLLFTAPILYLFLRTMQT